MQRWTCYLLIAIVFISHGASAEETGNEMTLFYAENEAWYPNFYNALTRLSHEEQDGISRADLTNQFYITPYYKDDTFYVYWRQPRILYIVQGAQKTEEQWNWLFQDPKYEIPFDEENVVKTPEEIGWSTYLVDEAWYKSKVADAVMFGSLVIIPPKKDAYTERYSKSCSCND